MPNLILEISFIFLNYKYAISHGQNYLRMAGFGRGRCFLEFIVIIFAALLEQGTPSVASLFGKVRGDNHYLIVSDAYIHTIQKGPTKHLHVCQPLRLRLSEETPKQFDSKWISNFPDFRLYPLRGGGRGLAPDPEDDSDVGSDWFPAEEQDKPYNEEQVLLEENGGGYSGDLSESHHSDDKWELKPTKVRFWR
jgi:hypothetical protein